MKIAVISTAILPSKPYRLFSGYGGLEKCAATWAEEFVKKGHQVLLIGAQGSYAEGCRVLEFPIGTPEDQMIQQAQNDLAEYDIWHDNTWGHFPVVLKLQGGDAYKNSRLMILHHGVLAGISTPPPLSRPNWTCFSAYHANYVASTLGISTRYVHHGIDTSVFKSVAKIARSDYYLVMSRLSPEKGVLQAVRELKAARVPVVVIADDRLIADQNYAHLVRQECDGYMTRFVSGTNMPLETQLAWLQSARALVHLPLSPWIEVFGLIVSEAMACGIPVIATRNGAIPEQVIHEKTGFLVDTPVEIASYLDRVDEIDPAACRRRVEELFTKEKSAAGHLALMEQILAGKEW